MVGCGRPIDRSGHAESSHKNPFWDKPFLGLLRCRPIFWRLLVTSIYSNSYQLVIDLLRKARKNAKLTQFQLAELLKKPQSFVSKYERGERRLDVIEFIEVCRWLKTDPHDIIREIEKV